MSDTSSTAVLAEDHFNLRLPGDPQIAPDGRHVAFVRNRADVETDGWASEVCVVDTASGAQVELGRGGQPRWAPDGASLALVTSAHGRFAIERWRADTGPREVLLQLAEAPGGLAWSCDGSQLAFVKRVPESPRALDVPAWEALRTPQWSPPGVYSEALVRRVEGQTAWNRWSPAAASRRIACTWRGSRPAVC